jgi:putative glycosyltransferase (TIGR04348 family)
VGRIPDLRLAVVRIVIVTPAAPGSSLGNSITADRWSGILRRLGHEVSIVTEWVHDECDLLITLHARRSYPSIERFHRTNPDRPLIVALTGTDLYSDLPNISEARHSLSMATRIVVLQSAALDELDDLARNKTTVIYQSAVPPAVFEPAGVETFDVCVLSHLRRVKDPLRAAFAARLLPAESRIRIQHAGRILEEEWEERVREEERVNHRYHWIGDQTHDDAMKLLARSRILVLSSLMEGGASAIAEAVVCGVPVLCSRIAGNIGMLETDYPGYFACGDTEQLAGLLRRVEPNPDFAAVLRAHIGKLQPRFSPEQELARWKELLARINR